MGAATLPFSIRKALPEDYPALTEIHNAAQPLHFKQTPEGLRRLDTWSRSIDDGFLRWLADLDGEVVATGWLRDSWRGEKDPGRFWTEVHTRADLRGQDIDSRLFRHALGQRDGVREVLSLVRDDMVEAAAFLASEGFRPLFRSWGARLDVRGFDAQRHAQAARRLEDEGLRLLSLQDLAADPLRDDELAGLRRELEADVLSFEPIIPGFSEHFPSADLVLHGSFVAVAADGAYLGLSCLEGTPGEKGMGFGLTGVRREHRGRGIAIALKVRVIEAAAAMGCEAIGTGGGGGIDAPMRRLNRKLGFEMEPAWCTYRLRRP